MADISRGRRPMATASLAGAVAAAMWVVPAVAAPATPEEAARLTALFGRYVGQPSPGQPGAVTVKPEGESYRVVLDLKRALAGFGDLGFTVESDPSETLLTPLPDGTWKVTARNSPPVTVRAAQQTLTFKSATSAFDGIYDPALYGFRSSTSTYDHYDYAQVAPTVDQDRQIEHLTFDLKGVQAPGTTTDVTAHYLATGQSSTILIKPPRPATDPGADPAAPPPEAPTGITYTSPSGTVDIGIGALHTRELLDLWAFLVAHRDRASIAASQDSFKTIVRAALPMLDRLNETAAFDGLVLNTPIGRFSAKALAGGLDVADLAGTGKASSQFSFDGLTIPPGQLPPWVEGFVPTAAALDIRVAGFHAAEAATAAVDDVDFHKEPAISPDQTDRLGRLFWPGSGTLTVAPSRITSKLLDLRMDGDGVIGPHPTGHLTVTGTGLDAAIAALKAAVASDPSAEQVLTTAVLAKNLAKANPDGSLTWLIEAKPDASVTVNGAQVQ